MSWKVFVYCRECEPGYCVDEVFGPFSSKEQAEKFGDDKTDDCPAFGYDVFESEEELP